MAVPNIFANVTTSIPLSELDNNFATPITIGNTSVQLGNTVTTLNNMTLANVTISSGNTTVTSETISGNLTFTGTGNRIIGDFGNATVANRVAFQTSTANSATNVSLLPSGTATGGSFAAYGDSDPTNASRTLVGISSTSSYLWADKTGTGSYLPMTFYTGGSERMRIDTSGNVGIGQATTPIAPLHIGLLEPGGEAIRLSWNTGTTTQAEASIGFGRSLTAVYPNAAISGQETDTSDLRGNLLFYTRDTDTDVVPTERMRIDSSGAVSIGSGEASATPVGNTLRAPDASGTNIAGGNLNISPGASTGNATGGYISFSSGVTPGASGTASNSLTERMRLYSSGTAADSPTGLQISTSGVYPSAVPLTNNGDRIASLMIHGLSESTASMGIVNWGASSGDEPNLNFLSLNGGTVGTFGTVPISGFNLANITFEGYSGSGSDMLAGAAILAEASATWTSTYAPTTLRFQTASSTSTLASRIVIDETLVYIASNTGFNISETAITTGSSAIGNVFSGTYTPTLTNVTNVAASTAYSCNYMRVGNVVTVSGRLNIDPTSATTASELGISLPIASDFTTLTECGGTGAIYSTTTEVSSGGISADAANDRAAFRFVSGGTAARDYSFTFTYKVI